MENIKFVIEKSARIDKLVDCLYEKMPEIESARGLLVTESYKQTEDLPIILSPDLKAGETYTVVGGGSTSAEVTDGVIDPATYTGFEVMGEIEAY